MIEQQHETAAAGSRKPKKKNGSYWNCHRMTNGKKMLTLHSAQDLNCIYMYSVQVTDAMYRTEQRRNAIRVNVAIFLFGVIVCVTVPWSLLHISHCGVMSDCSSNTRSIPKVSLEIYKWRLSREAQRIILHAVGLLMWLINDYLIYWSGGILQNLQTAKWASSTFNGSISQELNNT